MNFTHDMCNFFVHISVVFLVYILWQNLHQNYPMLNRIPLYEVCDFVMRYSDFCSSNIEYTLHKYFAKKILFAMLDNFKTGNIVQ